MAAPKGHKRYGGRVKGQPNKLTSSFKELVQTTFQQLEDENKGMKQWAETNKTEFYRIAAKLIPAEIGIKAEVVKKSVEYILPNGKTIEM